MNLLFTIAKADQEKIKNHPDIHFIGYIHERKSENVLITKQETAVPIACAGLGPFQVVRGSMFEVRSCAF